ncbi:MAG: MFS transporter [Verrucomicrobiales bacterium]|nr:MFS transporter [Verrucomicrobiales bacterium]
MPANPPENRSRFWRDDFPFRPRNLFGGRIFYGWVIAFGATIGILFSIPGQTMGFSVFTEGLMESLGLTRVQLSAAYCVGTVASGLTLPALGRLYDFWGGRKMAVVAALSTGFILFYLALISRIYKALPSGPVIAFLLIGLGFYLIRMSAQGVLTMSSRNLVGKWFDVRRGFALAVSGILVSFGFSAAPKFLDLLIGKFGPSGAWFVLGATTILVMAPLAYLVFRDAPEDCGMEMDGGKIVSRHAKNPDMEMHRDFTRAEALRTFSLWVFALSFAFFSLYSTAFTFHIVSLGAEFGFEKSRILNLFVPMAVVSVLTSLFCGWINSRTRLKWLLAAMNGGALLGAIGLLRLSEPGGVWLYVIGNGVCGGFFSALSGIVWPRFYGRKWLGSISGVNMSAMVIASGLGPLLFAFAVQATGSYGPALAGSIAIPALLMLASFGADNPQLKRDKKTGPGSFPPDPAG